MISRALAGRRRRRAHVGARKIASQPHCSHAATTASHVGRALDHERVSDQASVCRASITRLAASTEPHVYARNEP